MIVFRGAAVFSLLSFLVSGSAGSTCHGAASGSGGDSPSGANPGPPPSDVNLPGIDTSALTPREKKEWSSYVSEFLSPCSDTPVPIAQCVKEKRSCAKCAPAVKFVLKGVRDGMSREQVEKSYHG